MLADPETLRLPEITWRSIASSAATRTLPPASTWTLSATAPPWISACVVTLMTETPALTVTAALEEAATPAEIDSRPSDEIASTVTLPRALTTDERPIHAWVVLLTTSTSAPTPTPAEPPNASAPAMLRRVVRSVALTATPWVDEAPVVEPFTVLPRPTYAWVVWLCTPTTAEPATPAVPPPPPPIASVIMSSRAVAAMVVPTAPLALMFAAVTVSDSSVPDVAESSSTPTNARTVTVRTSTTEETPTPALSPKARPPAYSSSFGVPSQKVLALRPSQAATVTLPPAATVVGVATVLEM